MKPTAKQLQDVLYRRGSNRQAALEFGVDESTVRRWRKSFGIDSDTPQARVSGDAASIVTDDMEEFHLEDAERLIRANGLDPEDWELTDVVINKRQGPAPDGGVRTFHQLKLELKRKPSLRIISPAVHVPPVIPTLRESRAKGEAELIVVEGDHQIPYHDEALHRASLKFLQQEQPTRHIFLGDTVDFPTISRHNDNAIFNASPQECIQKGYELLREKREASPLSKASMIAGNHDWRIHSELLARAERLHGLRPASTGSGDELEAFSLRRLMHLDALGIEYVCPLQGWEHGEIEISPELVVRHGWITGAKTAQKTLDKLGRSVLVGHGHQREHSWKLVYSSRAPKLHQAVVTGTMSRLDLPFVVNPDWHQGFCTVSLFPDGNFVIEHAVWQDGALYWRNKKYTP